MGPPADRPPTMTEEAASVSDALPPSYHQSLFPPLPEPAFEASDERLSVWGALWGANSEVGRLRAVLMRRPGRELEQITADGWDAALQALVDPEAGWYWESDQPPDLTLVQEQYDGLLETLAAEGVDVHLADPVGAGYSKAMYTRDPLVMLPGGAVVGRLGPRMRRGEEQSMTRAVASLGMPILRTIVGTGLVEGGSFAKLTPKVAAFGTSIRCNDEGARQLHEVVRYFGIELIVVPMAGFSLHLDGAFAMVDVDKALVHAGDLPYWFLARLAELGIEPIWCHPDELWAVNSLAVSPGRVIMCDGYPYTAERLERRGVEVLQIPYGEIQKNGGGIHCSTIELIRDDV